MRCSECRSRPAVSIAIGKCEVCLYAEETDAERAARQVAAASAAEEKRKRERTVKR